MTGEELAAIRARLTEPKLIAGATYESLIDDGLKLLGLVDDLRMELRETRIALMTLERSSGARLTGINRDVT